MPRPLRRCRSMPAVPCKPAFLRWRVTTGLPLLILPPWQLGLRNGLLAVRSGTASREFNGAAGCPAKHLKYDSIHLKNLFLWKRFHRPRVRAGASGFTNGVREEPDGSRSAFA